MSENQPLTRAQLRAKWAKEAAQQPLTRREIRRREREEAARLQAIATGELSLTQQHIADVEIPAELTPPRPPHEQGQGEPARRSLRKELSERLDESGTRRGKRGVGEPDQQRAASEGNAAEKPASLPNPPAPTRNRTEIAQTPREWLERSVSEARYATILTGEIPAIESADETPASLPEDDGAASEPPARKPRRRPVAPPTTAQGVRVVDQATGEMKTITPENYPGAMSAEHSSLQAKIDAALPTPGQASEERRQDANAEASIPKRVSLLGDNAQSTAKDEVPSRREVHHDAEGEPEVAASGFATWLKIVLAVLAVVILGVLVWIVAHKTPQGESAAAAQISIITTSFKEPSA